jgi:hypothetical protein
MSLLLPETGVHRSPMLHAPGVFSHRSPLTDRSELHTVFPGRKTQRLDAVPRQHHADAAEYRLNIRQESDWIVGLGNPRGRAQGTENLRVGVTVLPENIPQEHQYRTLALLTNMERTSCLLHGWWWELGFRLRLAWVRSRYILWPRVSSGLL